MISEKQKDTIPASNFHEGNFRNPWIKKFKYPLPFNITPNEHDKSQMALYLQRVAYIS